FYFYTVASSIWVDMNLTPGSPATGTIELAVSIDIDAAQPKHGVIGIRVALKNDAQGKTTALDQEITLNGAILSVDESNALMNSRLVQNVLEGQLARLGDLNVGSSKPALHFANQ